MGKENNKGIFFITGVTGQVGSYLSELCVANGYKVFGMIRRCSQPRLDNVVELLKDNNFELIPGDLQDQGSLDRIIATVKPDYVANLAAQSYVAESFNTPVETIDVTGLGVVRLLEAIRSAGICPVFLQASSSEQFGNVVCEPQNEDTPFNIRSPYSAAKVLAHYMCINYRQAYGMKNRCVITFNNESPRRGIEFVTQKIVTHLAEIAFGMRDELILGNLDAKRDWSHTKDIVRAWLMIAEKGRDTEYVVGSGEHHSVREFLELSYEYTKGEADLYGATLPSLDKCYTIGKRFFRPTEVSTLLADYGKIRTELGWEPTISFKSLVLDMAINAVKGVHFRWLKRNQ